MGAAFASNREPTERLPLALLRRHAAQSPDAPCLVFGSERLSFAELDRRSSRLANALIASGVAPGDRIAILARNHSIFYELLFACAKSGAIMMPLNWRLSATEIASILADGEPRLLLLDPDLDFHPTAAAGLELVGLGEGFDEWRDSQSAADGGGDPDPDAVMLLLYTSGTTGRPKGVMITARNLSYVEQTAREAWGFTRNSVNIVAMPLFHVGGIGYGLMALSQGGLTVLLPQPDPMLVAQTARQQRATHGFFVPTVIERILDHLEQSGDPPPSTLKRIVYGAAPISEPTLKRALALLGCGFDHAYGMTETAGTVVTLPPSEHLTGDPAKLRSCGRALPWVELAIVDPATGTQVAPGEVGEIRVRSPMVTPGYWRQPEETAAAIDSDGWLRTGDAAMSDADGFITLVDRFKDMIVSGGENIYPREIENVLHQHPQVADVAVIGIPDPRWGETPAAFVIPSGEAEPTPDELRQFTREHLASFKCPSLFRIVPELPRNASGKVLKAEMRKPEWWSR